MLRLESREHSVVLNAVQTQPSCNSFLPVHCTSNFPILDAHSMVIKGSCSSELVATIPEITLQFFKPI